MVQGKGVSMIAIRYEFWYAADTCITVLHKGYVIGHGATSAEVVADAQRQANAYGCGGMDLRANGFDNYRANWEAAFGKSDLPDTAFLDSRTADRTVPKASRWRGMLERWKRVV